MKMLKTTLLLGMLTGILVLVGQIMGGTSGMILAFFFAIIMNFGSYWYSDTIVLKMYKAREVSPSEAPELHEIVENLATRADIPKPKVYIVNDNSPNAFATGRDPEHAAVAATTGILRLLTKEELEGVLGHELAHVKNRDTLISAIAATIAGVITMLAMWARWAAIFGGFGGDRDSGGSNIITFLALAILAPIAAMIVQLAISRSREYVADEAGAKICGNPHHLATALQKLERGAVAIPMDANPSTAHMFIVNPLKSGMMKKLFSTHPPTPERVARLEKMSIA
ncbi:MAG: zinc metalloprotease HtpX [Candidatus Hydrothermarchaeales archaeon]